MNLTDDVKIVLARANSLAAHGSRVVDTHTFLEAAAIEFPSLEAIVAPGRAARGESGPLTAESSQRPQPGRVAFAESVSSAVSRCHGGLLLLLRVLTEASEIYRAVNERLCIIDEHEWEALLHGGPERSPGATASSPNKPQARWLKEES